MVTLVDVLSSALFATVPVLLPALGESICERSGVYNIGIESIMLLAAATSFIFASFTGSATIGLFGGLLIGAIIGAIVAIFCVTIKADQVLVAMGLILIGPSLSSFLVLWIQKGLTIFQVEYFKPIVLFGGVFGTILKQNIIFYSSLLLVVIIWFWIFKTDFGLYVRAVGEDPHVADSAGINVTTIRYLAVILSGVLAGLGGIYMVLGNTGIWADNLTGGRGFIALAIVRVGVWKPHYILAAAFAYGLVDNVQLILQALYPGFPTQFLQMLPYLVGILIIVYSSRFLFWHGPKSLGKPYTRGERT